MSIKAEKTAFKKELLLCLFLSAITAILSFVYFIYQGGGAFTLVDDFNAQQIPFNVSMNNTIKDGGQWDWGLDLGTSLIQGFGFYGLGGIYSWIMMLFPSGMVPYLIGWVYILKYIVASLTSYLWLRQFVKNGKFAIAGALLYAFSGFQTTNLEFYHFHDVVSFFPLLLLGIDLLVRDYEEKYHGHRILTRGALLFTASIALNCLCNYYFFVEECVFIVLYFLFRYFNLHELKKTLALIVLCIAYAMLGVGMGAVLFLPCIIYILQGTRMSSEWYLSEFFPDVRTLLFLIKNYLFPAEAMTQMSSVIEADWSSASAYLPLVGISGVLAYLRREKHDWLSRFTKVLMVISFVPILSSGFLFFTESNQRWFFMMILMFCAATIIVLENVDRYPLISSALINIVCIVVFYLVITRVKWDESYPTQLVYYPKRFLLYTVIAVAGPVLVILISKRKGKVQVRSLLAMVSIFSTITTGATLHYYRASSQEEGLRTFDVAKRLETIDDQYRYRLGVTYYGLLSDDSVSVLSSFSSTISNSIREIDGIFDYNIGNFSLDKTIFPGMAELFAGKYAVTEDPSYESEAIRTYEGTYTTFYVVEREACPIGYAVEQYITEDEIHQLEVGVRPTAMLEAVVVDDETAALLDQEAILQKADFETIKSEIDGQDSEILQTYVDQYVQENSAHAVQNFSRDSHGFTCTSDYETETYVFFSVPYDDGWTATIDGEKATVRKSAGMMLLKVPAGMHTIEFSYLTPYYKEGAIISIIACVIFLGLFILVLRAGKKNRNE